MMSMSGGWFFVVASEAINVGDTKVQLPGIGSYLALAIEQRDIGAVGAAVVAMAIVILIYDQLIFRPVVAWADKFRCEATAAQARPRSWAYDIIRRTRFLKQIFAMAVRARDVLPRMPAEFTRGWARSRFPHLRIGQLGRVRR